MTLKDIKDRCDTAKITYQYGYVRDGVKPPYLCAVLADSNNFVADNKVYKKIDAIELYYTYKNKDITMEETIENVILDGVVWRKGEESWLSDEQVWQQIYYFNI